jgi:hypothetical protein
MKKMARFVWKNRWWALTIPPLVFVGVAVHVGAWLLAAVLLGGQIGDFHILPHAYPGGVSFGDISAGGIHNDVLFALAPSLAWLLIAAVGVAIHAMKGRSKRPTVDRLLFVSLLVLPLVSIAMELACSFSEISSNGFSLHPYRYLFAGSFIAVATSLIAIGWIRFRVVFQPAVSGRQYALGWAILLVLGMLLRHSATVWALIAMAA